jgi:hypothetical protein
MNWLNKLDDVLDQTFTPNSSRHGTNSESKPSNGASRDENDSSDSSSQEDLPSAVSKRLKATVQSPSTPRLPGRLRKRQTPPIASSSSRYPGNLKRQPRPSPPPLPVANRINIVDSLVHRPQPDTNVSMAKRSHSPIQISTSEKTTSKNGPAVSSVVGMKPDDSERLRPPIKMGPTKSVVTESSGDSKKTPRATSESSFSSTDLAPTTESSTHSMVEVFKVNRPKERVSEQTTFESVSSDSRERSRDSRPKTDTPATRDLIKEDRQPPTISPGVPEKESYGGQGTVRVAENSARSSSSSRERADILRPQEPFEIPIVMEHTQKMPKASVDAQVEPAETSLRGGQDTAHFAEERVRLLSQNSSSSSQGTNPVLNIKTNHSGPDAETEGVSTQKQSVVSLVQELNDTDEMELQRRISCEEGGTNVEPSFSQPPHSFELESLSDKAEPSLSQVPVSTQQQDFREIKPVTARVESTEYRLAVDDVGKFGDVPEHLEHRSEFDVAKLSRSWAEEDEVFDRRMNCHGTVHVRIFRAQRLPCPNGAAVQCVVSLKPWRGKVRTVKTNAFHGPADENGVCVNWEEDETSPLTMVHAYSSDESPIPSIQVDLKFIPLGVFGFTMASLTLSCETLLMNPNQAKRKWFVMKTSASESSVETLALDDHVPLVEIEAMFEPSRDPNDELAIEEVGAPVDVVEVAQTNSYEGSVVEEASVVQTRSGAASALYDDDVSSHMTHSGSMQSYRRLQAKTHRLRLQTFRMPAKCCVCKKSILSGLWKMNSFRCEECSVDCCGDCRLQIDIKLPCGSDLARDAVSSAIQNTLSIDKILNILAPVDHSNKPAQTTRATPVGFDEKDEEGSAGIGILNLEFVRSFVLQESVPPETDPAEVLGREQTSFREGDYYMRVTRVGSNDTARTHTIQNTGKPKFEAEQFRLKV